MLEIFLKVLDLPDKQEGPPVVHLFNALKDRMDNRMSTKELTATCFEWSYFYVFEEGGYLPELLPEKPFEVRNFDKLSKKDKEIVSVMAVDKIREIRVKWMNQRSSLVVKNESNYLWLFKMAYYFDSAGKPQKAASVRKRMELYEINDQCRRTLGCLYPEERYALLNKGCY